MSKKFENKVVIVTGGTSGIGLATAKAFVHEGASVFITGRRKEPLDAAVKEIGSGVTTFDTNVKGVLFTVQKALPLLRDGASIVLNASTTSISGTPAFSVYSATKAAVRNFARSWILDLRDRRIRVNAVSPGVTDTAGLNELFGNGESAENTKNYLAGLIPAGRIGKPEEIAKAVLFLASDDASFVNGVELFVDGGQVQI